MSFLFESVEGGAVRGRYSVIGLDPDLIWRTERRTAPRSTATRASTPDGFAPCPQPPLEALRALIAESRIALPEGLPPMAAGVFGYLGYDMVRLMEELPASHPDPIGIPDAVLIRPTLVVVFDAVKDAITVVTPVRPEPGVAAKAALARAASALAGVVDALDQPLDKAAAGHAPGPLDIPPKSNTSPAEFRTMVQNGQGLHPAPAIFSRSCCRSVSRRRSRCRRSRSTARSAASTRRRSFIFSTSAAMRSPDRAPKCWCGCATAR